MIGSARNGSVWRVATVAVAGAALLSGTLLLAPAVAVGTMAAAALVVAGAPADPASARPTIRWQRCAYDPAFECGVVRAPMDYDRPQGRKIRLAVIRHRATGDRIGSLFFNPGGPGGPGVTALPTVLHDFPKRLRDRFDLVSWDPRGVGQSTAVQCFASQQAEQRYLDGVPAAPVGKRQVRLYAKSFKGYAKRCAERNGALLRHVSTADTARDLNLLRRAVGDRRLNYWGISYGTFLGATYANLFPRRVRAMTLDGNVIPDQFVVRPAPGRFLPTFLRQGSDRGAAVTMAAFLRRCGAAGAAVCPFAAADVDATMAKFETLMRQMRRHPLRERGGVTYSVLLDQSVNGLYSIDVWPRLAEFLQNVWTDTPTTTAQSLAAPGYAPLSQALAILCGDSPNPPVSRFPAASAFAVRRSGALAPYWAWATGACPAWRAAAANPYIGPWDRRTRRPLLVVGNTHDPATPLHSSRVMARELDRARLLVVRGFGHTALTNPSTCANRHLVRYFLTSKLPPRGTRCTQDNPPFAR